MGNEVWMHVWSMPVLSCWNSQSPPWAHLRLSCCTSAATCSWPACSTTPVWTPTLSQNSKKSSGKSGCQGEDWVSDVFPWAKLGWLTVSNWQTFTVPFYRSDYQITMNTLLAIGVLTDRWPVAMLSWLAALVPPVQYTVIIWIDLLYSVMKAFCPGK